MEHLRHIAFICFLPMITISQTTDTNHVQACLSPKIDHLKSLSPIYSVGHLLKLICEDDYMLHYGTEVFTNIDITCNMGGDWITHKGINNFPTCLAIKKQENICPHPEYIKNGFYDISGQQRDDGSVHYEAGTKTFYICQEGYKLVGSEHRVCQDGQWVGELPKCVPLGCPRPVDIANGGYNLFGQNDTSGIWIAEGSQVYYYCHNGYKLSKEMAPTKRMCQDGQWIGDVPTCLKRTHCDMPQEIPNGNYVIEDLHPDTTNYGIDTKIMYECDEGFLAYGAVTITCTSSGYWSDYPPKCIEKDQYCPNPGKVENGNFVCPDGCGMYKVGTNLHFICDDNFEPVGLVKQTCLQGGQWSAQKPTCSPVPVVAMSENLIEINAKPTTVVIATSCSVLGLLLIVMVIVALQRHKKPSNRLCSPLGQPPPPPYTRPRTEGIDELDRVALIAFADGVQVTLPSYDEAIRGRLGSRYISEVTGMRHPTSSGEYRPLPNIPVGLRSVSDHHRNSIITTTSTTTRDNLSLAFGSMDTMNVSDGTSTTITVDTLDSGASNPSLALSQRAVAGSIASSNGSVSNVNDEAPLLEQHNENGSLQNNLESPSDEPKQE